MVRLHSSLYERYKYTVDIRTRVYS